MPTILSSPYLSLTLLLLLTILIISIFWKRFRVNLRIFWHRIVSRGIRLVVLRLFNWLLKLIGRIVTQLQVWENWMISKKRLPKTGMRDLSPTLLADKDRGYSNTLKWALENKSIKNLAISGPYGSGKSSIIKIFQRRHPEYHYLNISLASFKEAKKAKVELVLLSILQQVFYYVKSKEMPESRYKRINPVSSKAALFKSIALILWLVSLCFLIKPDWFKLFPFWEQLKSYDWVRYLILFILIGGGIAIVYSFLKLYNNFQLNKLNIASGQLEIQPKSESSILNKYLDEILYFFEISKYDVVIIEDIDRFKLENTEVFTKLRELNTLINNAQQIGRHVVFVYAIRDEIFKNDDRTKFFDFILPVIPVINSSNSGDLLSRQLTDAGFSGLINTNFISKMSDYITDMRLLINIMNEFLVYKKTIGNFDFEPNNLLGMTIYKNIEPDDFALLQKDEGTLYDFIHKRQDYNEPLTKQYNDKYKKLAEEIAAIEDSAIANIQELRSLYLFGLFSRLQSNAIGQIDLGNGFMSLKQLASESNFPKVISSQNITYQYAASGSYGPQSKTQKYAFSEVEDEIGNSQGFELREKLIKVKADNLVDEKKKELEHLQEQINRIRFAKIKELSTISTLEEINPIVKDKKLLIYLLEQGYIDEHYRNYISYFYGESMTSADRDFIMGVNYNREMDIGFTLGKVHEVVKKLSIDDFNKPQIINISLLDFLLGDMETYEDQIRHIFAQISTNSDFAKGVREKYRKEGAQKGNFTFQLAKFWPKFWEYIQLESKYSAVLQRKYLEDILNFASVEDISLQNHNNLLSTYISEMEDFQEFNKGLTNQAQTDLVLTQLNIRFSKFSAIEDKHIFNLLLQQNLYAINPQMLNLIIKFSGEKRSMSLDGMETRQLTFLKEFGDEKIIEYVNSEINSYVSNVLLKLEGNIEESDSTLVGILNSSEVQDEAKINLLVKQNSKIQALYKVEDNTLWTEIIQNDKMVPTWHNVTTYYQLVSEINQTVADYLNISDNFDVLEKDLVTHDTDIAQEEVSTFYEALITSTLLHDLAVDHLVKSIPHTFAEINLDGISNNRVNTLIKNNFLEINKDNYKLLKVSHNGKNIEFLEFRATDLPDWVSDVAFDASDYLLLFKSNVFTTSDKFYFAEDMPLEILEQDHQIADLLSQLYANSDLEVPNELFNAIISNATNPQLKVQMVLQQQANFSTARYVELLPLMGASYSAILTESKVAKLQNTDYNLSLGELLNKRDIISSVTGKNEKNLRLNMFQKEK